MCSWAIVSTCTGAVQDFRGLLALRFVLGFVEAPFFREFIFPIHTWLGSSISLITAAFQLVHYSCSLRGIPERSLRHVSRFFTSLHRYRVLLGAF